MGINIDDYRELDQSGFESGAKESIFHAVYITGQDRENDILGITEEIGKMQIRNVKGNLDTLYMVILHTRRALVNEQDQGDRRNTVCFSYTDVGQPPWFGSKNKKECGINAAARKGDPFCKDCRNRIFLGAYLSEANGRPITVTNEDGEKTPIFLYFNGRGYKYDPIRSYLTEVYDKDFSPVITPETQQSKLFEKKNINYKRIVTKVTVASIPTDRGPQKVFKFEMMNEIPKESIKGILDIAKKTMLKFQDKLGLDRLSSGSSNQESRFQFEDVPETIKDVEPPWKAPSPPKETLEQEGIDFGDIKLDF